MGYRGTNQFWFGIQAPDARNYGMEVNNQINEIVTTNLLTPQADFKVYNCTIIAPGLPAPTSQVAGMPRDHPPPVCRHEGLQFHLHRLQRTRHRT